MEQLKQQVKEFESKLAEMGKEVENTTSELKNKYSKEISEIKTEKAALELKLKSLLQSTSEAWTEVSKNFDGVLSKAKHFIQSTLKPKK